jgi:hypothetical protein
MPENGEVLTPKIIAIVGSSTLITGSGFGLSTSVIVSPMLMSSNPASATISPTPALSTVVRFKPSKT